MRNNCHLLIATSFLSLLAGAPLVAEAKTSVFAFSCVNTAISIDGEVIEKSNKTVFRVQDMTLSVLGQGPAKKILGAFATINREGRKIYFSLPGQNYSVGLEIQDRGDNTYNHANGLLKFNGKTHSLDCAASSN